MRGLERRERMAVASRFEKCSWRGRGVGSTHILKGLWGPVEKLEFLLRKGLVISSISLAMYREWIAVGLRVAAQGWESWWGLSWGSENGD